MATIYISQLKEEVWKQLGHVSSNDIIRLVANLNNIAKFI
jgi:hypothetical protein